MLLARFFPARKTRTAFCVLFALLLAVMGAVAHAVSRGTLARVEATASMSQVLDALKLTEISYLPSQWIARGIIAAAAGETATALFYFLALLSTALMGLQLCSWLAPSIYYAGWVRTRESEERSAARGFLPIFDWIEALLRPLRRPTRALFLKDLKVFWRDPAQWAQLLRCSGC